MKLIDNYTLYDYNNSNDKYRYIYDVVNLLNECELVTKKEQKKNKKYINVECGFDCETTSHIVDGKKCAWVYEWTLGIKDKIIYGRKIEDFVELLNNISEELKLSETKILTIYVHNLSFDFQFFKKYININKTLKLDERTIISALTENGIMFKCSYMESGKSLYEIGNELGCNKKVGDLDYNIIRHSETKLDEKEIEYCAYDVVILLKYIKEKIEEEGNINKIQNTVTAYVRRYCKEKCLQDESYRKMIKKLKVGYDEYVMLKQEFSGGFTHANNKYAGEIMEDVDSFDFTSSYPSVMLSEKFPSSRGRKVKIKNDNEFWYYLENKCCLFTVELYDVISRGKGDNILSVSKCVEIDDFEQDNGRIIRCNRCVVIMNEVDFLNLCAFYKFKYKLIGDFYIYNKDYLPKKLIECVIDLYEKKTTLKGVQNKEKEYKKNKSMLNSIYGMMVMDIVRNKEGNKEDNKKEIDAYNNSFSRFTFYAWGVWITSYARRNLYTAILELEDDYIYSDTDSVKVMNYENHKDYFEKYNENIEKKVKKCLESKNIDINRGCPQTVKGTKKQIGVWDREEHIKKFKTLGAKRYCYQTEDNEWHLTVAGIDKKKGMDYLLYLDKENPLYNFEDGLVIPKEKSGKKVHTYIDDEFEGYVTDYEGNTAFVSSKSCIHISECEFSLSMDDEYIKLINGNKSSYVII